MRKEEALKLFEARFEIESPLTTTGQMEILMSFFIATLSMLKSVLVLTILVGLTFGFRPLNLRTSRSVSLALSGAVTAQTVKELREKSGAGMLDCKKALSETGGDVELAVDWLRKKGLAAVAKKAGRTASSGFIGIGRSECGLNAALIEMNCETDFSARNDIFVDFVNTASTIAVAAKVGNADGLLDEHYSSEGGLTVTVRDKVTSMIATIGENMNLRRTACLSVEQGLVATYMHMAAGGQPRLGKLGVAVALQSAADPSALEALGRSVAMHIAAQAPLTLGIADLDHSVVEREKAVLTEQARSSGKPEAAVEKIVEGRMRKYYEENCLLEQPFVMDGKVKVKDLVAEAAKDLGTAVEVVGYSRMLLGDGLKGKEEEED